MIQRRNQGNFRILQHAPCCPIWWDHFHLSTPTKRSRDSLRLPFGLQTACSENSWPRIGGFQAAASCFSSLLKSSKQGGPIPRHQHAFFSSFVWVGGALKKCVLIPLHHHPTQKTRHPEQGTVLWSTPWRVKSGCIKGTARMHQARSANASESSAAMARDSAHSTVGLQRSNHGWARCSCPPI